MSADGGKGIGDREVEILRDRGFQCPSCGAYIAVEWKYVDAVPNVDHRRFLPSTYISVCLSCASILLALEDRLVYPSGLIGPAPSPDMPDLVRTEYDEARQVGAASPRAAAALLRLAVQKLVDQLKPGKGDLNVKIGMLADEGAIRPKLVNMLDVVRVTGNNAVHPGTMDLDDEPERVITLFKLVNAIVEQTITLDNLVAEAHASLPEAALNGIAERPAKVQKLRDKSASKQA